MISTTKNPAQRAGAGRARKTFSCLAARNGCETNWPQDRGDHADISDCFDELRELAGDLLHNLATEAPTAFAIWSGGGTPAQALSMINTILPKQAAA